MIVTTWEGHPDISVPEQLSCCREEVKTHLSFLGQVCHSLSEPCFYSSEKWVGLESWWPPGIGGGPSVASGNHVHCPLGQYL